MPPRGQLWLGNNTRVYTHARVHRCTQVCTHAYVHANMHAHSCTHMHSCTRACAHAHTHTLHVASPPHPQSLLCSELKMGWDESHGILHPPPECRTVCSPAPHISAQSLEEEGIPVSLPVTVPMFKNRKRLPGTLLSPGERKALQQNKIPTLIL
jgi:hypothetical protein